jgi:hypothetical protein
MLGFAMYTRNFLLKGPWLSHTRSGLNSSSHAPYANCAVSSSRTGGLRLRP